MERRSGVTGALTWPWCCLTSHTPWTWTLAPSPPWVTLWVGLRQKGWTTKGFYSSQQQTRYLTFLCVRLILCWCSFQGADRRCALLLPDGPSWSGSLYQEEHQDGFDWLQPQVRERERSACTQRSKDLLRQEYSLHRTSSTSNCVILSSLQFALLSLCYQWSHPEDWGLRVCSVSGLPAVFTSQFPGRFFLYLQIN